jgi:hypothetical protein
MLVKVTDGVPTPYSYTQLRRDNPQVSFPKEPPPELLKEYGVYESEVLAESPTEFHEEGTATVSIVDGKAVIDKRWTPIDLAAAKAKAVEKLSALRRAKIDAGFDFGGLTVPCDDESQRVYTAAYVLAKDFPDMKRKWKMPSGFVELGATELQQLAILASQHVQACFDWQAEQAALVEATKDVAEIDAILKAAK